MAGEADTDATEPAAHAGEPAPSSFARALGALVDRLTHTRGRAALVVGVALLIGLLAAWWGRTIRIDTDLRALLPTTLPILSQSSWGQSSNCDITYKN